MHAEGRLSLVELSTAAAPLSPSDVAAVVAAVCRVTLPGDAVGPTNTQLRPEDVWLDRAGTPHLVPGVIPTISALGALLEHLLAEIRRAGPSRLPPGLFVIAARATGRIDLAPFPSCEALARALARFEPPDAADTLRALFERADTARRHQQDPLVASRQMVIAADTNVAAEYEYQKPAVTPDSATRLESLRPPVSRRRGRPVAMAAVGVLALMAGFAAGVLSVPDAPTRRITDTTDVIVRPPSDGTTQRRATNPSGAVRALARPRQAPPAASIAASAAPSRGELGKPQPLVDPIQAQSDKVFSPFFDQHGSAVFFHAETANGSALKRAEPGKDGVLHVVTILDDAAKNYHVQLSPDGRSVAFDSDRDGVRGVYVARADGTQVRRVSGAGYAAVPTWSPDGSRLAFLRAENDRSNVWNLWIRDLDSGEMIRLTHHRYGQVWGGAWFPDGRRLAYSHEDQLILLDLSTGRTTTYVSPLKGRLVRTPAVSPDGRWIIFQVFRDGAWLLNVGDGSTQRVLDDASAEEFTWAPNGRGVAFHSRRRGGWGLWLMTTRE